VSVVVSKVEGAVGRITLNRPEVMNAVSVELAESLQAALEVLSETDGVRVITIRGAGGNFCAGGDFGEVQRLTASQQLDTLFASFRAACRKVRTVPQPVVTVVEGVAMAGGFELMQAADLALVRDDARISDNHINHGMVPGGGGSQRLPRLLGRHRAMAHLLTGERLTGLDAEALGLAQSFAPDLFDSSTEAIVQRLASRDPRSLATIKRLVHDGLDLSLEDGLDLEQEAVVRHISLVEPDASRKASDASRPPAADPVTQPAVVTYLPQSGGLDASVALGGDVPARPAAPKKEQHS